MGKFISKVVKFAITSPLSLIDKDLGRVATAVGLTALGIATGNFALISAGVSMGASLLAPKPKSPNTSGSTLDRLQASVNLRTPRTMVFGSTAMATDIRDQEWSGQQEYLHRFIVVASHKARAIREIWFDDKLAWSSAGGVTSAYAGYLVVTPVLEGSAANAVNIGARMGSSRRYTGCAYVYLRYKLTGNTKKTESPFAGGSIPSRMTIIGDGIAVPDPRASGFNAADQTTWSTDANACRNPALAMLAYLLGWRINGKLAVGKGIPPARIDLASFATAANLCDEPVTRPNGTSEPRYHCDGIVSEGDETGLVLDNLKATMNAVLDDVDGKIRLSILYNDLATPIGELTTADVIGEYTWDQTPPLSDTFNIVRGGYTDPSTTSLYQLVDYPEVSIASADGIDRIETVNLPMVQSAGQAQRLAKLRLSRQQFGGTFNAVFQATAWKFQKGDAIRFTFYPLGWDKKLFRIADMTVQVDGTVPMMLREEDPAIYAAYSDEAAPIAGTAPTTYDPSLWPVIQGIVDVEAQIARAVSDGWLDPSEKRQAKIDYDQRTAQRDALQARYVALGSPSSVTAARDNAFAKVQSLYDYLQGLSPSWLDYTTLTQVPDPAGYQAAWKASADALEAFGAAITGLEGPPGKDGTSAFTLKADGPITINGNNAVKGNNTDAAQIYSVNGYRGAAALSFTLPDGNHRLALGLGTNPGFDPTAQSIEFAFVFTPFEPGVVSYGIMDRGTYTALGGVSGGDFGIAYNGKTVRWLFNGAVVVERFASAGLMLYVDSDFTGAGTAGASVTDIAFTPAGTAGDDGTNGEDGADGADGLSLDVTGPESISVPCYADGTPRPNAFANANGKFVVRQGQQAVTSGVTYSIVQVDGCTPNIDANGNWSFTGLTRATGAYAVFQAVYGTAAPFRKMISISKALDGSSASYNQNQGALGAFGTATFVLLAEVDLTVPPNATVMVAGNTSYGAQQLNGRTFTAEQKLTYQNITDGGAETDVPGSTAQGSTASFVVSGTAEDPITTDTPGSAASSGTFAAASTAKTFRARLYIRKSGGNGNAAGINGLVSIRV